jgi:LPS sulfotransferase NodH
VSSLAQRIAETGKRCYVLLFGIRSGSTLLCDDLRLWGFGSPTEYFQEPLYLLQERPARDYILSLVENTAADWFGFKINWHQANSLIARLAAEGDCSPDATIWSIFPGLQTLELVRKDKVLQAVSGWRAATSNVWHVRAGELVDPGRPPYDYEGIMRFFNAVVTEEWLWADKCRELAITPRRLVYEDYIEHRRPTMEEVSAFLGAPGREGRIDDLMTVLRDDWSHAMADRFRTDLRRPAHEYWDIFTRLAAENGGSASFAA